jgi:hypothetical protein
MECSPTESVEVVKVAVAVVVAGVFRGTFAARVFVPSKKLTVPVRLPVVVPV